MLPAEDSETTIAWSLLRNTFLGSSSSIWTLAILRCATQERWSAIQLVGSLLQGLTKARCKVESAVQSFSCKNLRLFFVRLGLFLGKFFFVTYSNCQKEHYSIWDLYRLECHEERSDRRGDCVRRTINKKRILDRSWWKNKQTLFAVALGAPRALFIVMLDLSEILLFQDKLHGSRYVFISILKIQKKKKSKIEISFPPDDINTLCSKRVVSLDTTFPIWKRAYEP